MNRTFFETIRSIKGKTYNISYHQERYESVLKIFGIKEVYEIQEFLHPPKDGIYRCRFVYDLSNTPHTVKVTYHIYQKRMINSLKLVYNDDIEYALKSTCRDELDKLYLLKEDCDDVIIVKNSLITDTTIANIAFFDTNRWVTPASPLLKGTTRERLLREGRIHKEDIHVDDMNKFSKIALMNAMIDFDIITKNTKEVLC